MNPALLRAAAPLLCAITVAAAPAFADSVASSALSAGSASIGSLSDSVRGSSRSSTRHNDVAEGDWRLVEVAALAERPGVLRLRMQPPAAAGGIDELCVDVPQQALQPQAPVVGELVRVRHRPYGVELARGPAREPFFLLLDDDWRHELELKRVAL